MRTLCITPTRSCGPPPNVSTRALGLLPRHGMFPMRYQHAIIAKHVCGAHSCALRDRGKRAADPALPSRLQSLAIAGDTIAAKTATRMSHNRADDRPLRWRWQCVGRCWPDTRTTAHSGLHTGHGSSHVLGAPGVLQNVYKYMYILFQASQGDASARRRDGTLALRKQHA